ncbi:MAG: hypothetical protein ABIZ50_01330 [Solirubrobacterales bacterium]
MRSTPIRAWNILASLAAVLATGVKVRDVDGKSTKFKVRAK